MLRRSSRPLPPRDARKRFGGAARSIHRSTEEHRFELRNYREQRDQGTENKHEGSDKDSPPQHSAKKVRKGLNFGENANGKDEFNTGISQAVLEEPGEALVEAMESGSQMGERGVEDDQFDSLIFRETLISMTWKIR
ncbi:unnamed protein product [Thlaspi arvense]|uniref:Uncharacterized protein n=1 Tax=Thlaspi arvense TaxID=13288 RepID=A0AAU9SK08_THLAR|nr:unnamed protein product [Thlaspi arvense]